MIIDILKYTGRFLFILFLQVFIISKLNIGTYVNPNLMVYFLILLPINLKPAPTLFISFFTGLILDMFSDTPGYCSTSLLIAAYARIYYIRSFAHLDIIESGAVPNVVNMGLRWFLFYSVSMILTFHVLYVIVQTFTMRDFFGIILEALISGTFTLGMVLLSEFLFYRSKLVG